MSDEDRAIDLVLRGEIVLPRLCGDAAITRIGHWGWQRPRYAKGRRMFRRCGIPDPWDPNSVETPLDLPNVGMSDRRTVAPHAAPPKSAGPASPQGFNPRIPTGGKPTGMGSAEGGGSAAGLIGQTRRDDTADLKRRMAEKESAWTGRPRAPAGGDTHRVAQPVKPMPMRPDVAAAQAAAGQRPQGPAPSQGPAKPLVPAQRPLGPPRMSIAPDPARGAPVPRPSAPIRSGDGRAAPRSETAERVLPPRAPPPVGKVSSAAPRSGGFRMAGGARAPVGNPFDSEPEELPLDAPAGPASSAAGHSGRTGQAGAAQAFAAHGLGDGPEELPLDAPLGAPRSAPPAAPPPAPARPARPVNLDDMFGMGSEPTTRIRIPKAEPKVEGEAKPRRPMVSDPASLAGGIDRRPPPPKPPVIKPAGGSGGGSDDLPDE